MKKIISSAVLLILLSVPLYSQNADSTKNTSDFSRKHRWAVQFGIDYNLSVVSFNGVLISLKYHLSEKSAIRFGAGYTENRKQAEQNTLMFLDTIQVKQSTYIIDSALYAII